MEATKKYTFQTAYKWINIGKADLVKSANHIVKTTRGNATTAENESAYQEAKRQLLELEYAEAMLKEIEMGLQYE